MCKRGRGGHYSKGSPSVEEENPDQTAFLNDLRRGVFLQGGVS